MRFASLLAGVVSALAFLSLVLAACGNKGPLVLQTAPAPEGAPPVEAVPASTAPTPESLNDATRPAPVQGTTAEDGTPPTPASPPHP